MQQQLTGQGRHVRLAVQAPEGGLVRETVRHQVHHRELTVQHITAHQHLDKNTFTNGMCGNVKQDLKIKVDKNINVYDWMDQ